MPEPVSAGIAAVSSIGSAVVQGSAAKRAGRAQTRANDQAIAEQRRQFDMMRGLLSPYVNAGAPALQGLMDIAGLSSQGSVNWGAYVQGNPDALANWNAPRLMEAGFDQDLLKEFKTGAAALVGFLGAEETAPEFKEYGEDIADDIQVCECPTCGHKHAAKKD